VSPHEFVPGQLAKRQEIGTCKFGHEGCPDHLHFQPSWEELLERAEAAERDEVECENRNTDLCMRLGAAEKKLDEVRGLLQWAVNWYDGNFAERADFSEAIDKWHANARRVLAQKEVRGT
jgi:hypothetical protein